MIYQRYKKLLVYVGKECLEKNNPNCFNDSFSNIEEVKSEILELIV